MAREEPADRRARRRARARRHGIAGGGSNGGGQGGETVNYQLGWLKSSKFGGFFAADKQGFYTDEGIAPEFTAGGSNILSWQHVVIGKALLGDEDNTNALVAIEDGQPLVIIGTVFQTSPFDHQPRHRSDQVDPGLPADARSRSPTPRWPSSRRW